MTRQTFDMDTATAPAPAAPAPDCSDADLYAAAAAADAGQPLPAASTASPAPEAPPDTTAAPVETRKPESADDRADREEAELAEQAAVADRAAPESKPKEADAAAKPAPETPYTKAQKEKERQARLLHNFQAEKEAVRQEAERIKQERAEFTRLRQEHEELKKRLAAPAAPVKDEHGHTAEDYERLAKRYEREEDHEMAKLAMAKASGLKAKAAPAAPAAPAATQQPANDPTTPEFQAKWRETTAALVQAEPDLAKPDNPVVQAANALLQDKNWSGFFLSRPDGIRAAVEVARLQQTAARAATFEKELATAKAEIARLTRLVSPRGSLPASAAPGDRRPEDLSDADMLALAAQADQGG